MSFVFLSFWEVRVMKTGFLNRFILKYMRDKTHKNQHIFELMNGLDIHTQISFGNFKDLGEADIAISSLLASFRFK